MRTRSRKFARRGMSRRCPAGMTRDPNPRGAGMPVFRIVMGHCRLPPPSPPHHSQFPPSPRRLLPSLGFIDEPLA